MDKETNSWIDVRKLIDRVISEPSVKDSSRIFLEVIDDFAKVLSEASFMRSYISSKSKNTIPQIWSLHTRPRFRPNEGSIMLTFAVYLDFVRILGDEEELKTPDDLRRKLSKFATDTFFPSTVAEYQSRFKQDVSGALQKEKHMGPTTEDTIVSIPWNEHHRLGSKAEDGGGKDEFLIRLDHVDGFPDFSPRVKYRYLYAAGYFAKILDISETKADIIKVFTNVEQFTEPSDSIQ